MTDHQPSATSATDAWRSAPELLVLHAVRLGGFAETPAVAERAGLDIGTTEGHLLDLARGKLIERTGFAETSGWILTDQGKNHLNALLAREREAAGAESMLTLAADRFEEINAPFVTLLSIWQLQSPAEQQAHRAQALDGLSGLAIDLGRTISPLAAGLARFNRYTHQFTEALQKARAGEDRWVAGVGILSCHTVWAELHQDLLSSLGRTRGAQPGAEPTRPAP